MSDPNTTPAGRDFEAVVRGVLGDVAPDVDAQDADVHADFHEEFGLDSMDTLNLAIGLAEAAGIDIPERDYPQIASISSCVAYLEAHVAR